MWRLDPNQLGIDWKYKSGDGVLAICENPNHDDNHPSMFVNLVSGEEFFYCFSCQFKGSINKLTELTGGNKKYTYDEVKGVDVNDQEWRSLLKNPLAINDQYLIERGVTRKEVDRFDIRSNNSQIIFPLNCNLTDEVIGVKIRLKNPIGKIKYLTFGKQPDYIISREYKGSDSVGQRYIVTEGMFGLSKFYRYDINAITPLSSNRYHNLYQYMKINKYQSFYILFDPDFSGYYSAMKLLFDCRALNNVYAFKVFADIDLASDKVMQEFQTASYSQITTRDSFELLDNIENLYGEDVRNKTRDRFMKHIYTSTK